MWKTKCPLCGKVLSGYGRDHVLHRALWHLRSHTSELLDSFPPSPQNTCPLCNVPLNLNSQGTIDKKFYVNHLLRDHVQELLERFGFVPEEFKEESPAPQPKPTEEEPTEEKPTEEEPIPVVPFADSHEVKEQTPPLPETKPSVPPTTGDVKEPSKEEVPMPDIKPAEHESLEKQMEGEKVPQPPSVTPELTQPEPKEGKGFEDRLRGFSQESLYDFLRERLVPFHVKVPEEAKEEEEEKVEVEYAERKERKFPWTLVLAGAAAVGGMVLLYVLRRRARTVGAALPIQPPPAPLPEPTMAESPETAVPTTNVPSSSGNSEAPSRAGPELSTGFRSQKYPDKRII